MHFLRQLLKGWVGKLAIAIISLTFIISLFAGSIIAQGAKGEAVVVGDQVITVEQIRQRVDQQKAQWRERMGDQANETLINSLINTESVKRELVDEGLLRDYAAKSNMQISDETIGSIIRSQEMFLDDRGLFSESLFQQVLRNNGTSPAQYIQYVSNSLVLNQLRQGFGNTSFDVEKQHQLASQLNTQARDFDYVIVDKAAFRDDVSVSDEDILVYYNANPDRFQTEETAVFDYIRLEKSALQNQVDVTEDDIARAYENMVAEWNTQEQRNIATIQLDTNAADFEEKKAAVEAGIAAGEDFATLAKEYSDDFLSAQNGGELGFISMGTLGEDFDNAVFALEKDAVSASIEEGDMVYFAKLLAVKTADIKPLSEVESQAAEKARITKAEDRFSELEVILDERIYDGYGLSEIAEETGLTVINAGATPVRGGFGWLSDPEFVTSLNTPEALEDNETTMVRLTDGSLVAFKVSEHKTAQTKPLDDVKATITALIQDEKATEIAQQKAAEAVARLQTDAAVTLETIAGELNQPVESKTAITRDAVDVPRDIAQVAFKAIKPAADATTYTSGELTSRNHVIVALKSVVQGEAEASEQTVNQINTLRAVEESVGMLANIRSNTRIKEFENNVESAFE